MKTMTREKLNSIKEEDMPPYIYTNGRRYVWDLQKGGYIPDGSEMIGDEVLIVAE